MQRLLFAMAGVLLMGCSPGLAQVSTMGTTAMGIPSTPGTIVTSPLYGPSPFSATTQPGAPVTTLAPVPLASDPATPGTVVTCSTPTGQISPGTPTVTVTPMPAASSTPATGTGIGTTPPVYAAPASPGTTTASPLGAIATPLVASRTGTVAPVTSLGNSSSTICSTIPGGPPTNAAALPLSTPQIATNPPPGTIQSDVTPLAGTSIDPTMTVVPTPNTPACAEGTTMNLATPGMMTPANPTGAPATPGVSPQSPPGC
jgi:hypothetical protein